MEEFEKFDLTKLEEYQKSYTEHSKKAFKYKNWINEIIKLEYKKEKIISAPLYTKDIDYIVDYLREQKRPVTSTELMDHINTNYKPAYKRWTNKIESGNFYSFFGSYMKKRSEIVHWPGHNERGNKTTVWQIK